MSAQPDPEVHWPPGWGPDRCDSFVSHERRVPARADELFTRLTAITGWPQWQRGVERTETYDGLVVGGRFLVVTAPHALDGIIGELDRPVRFGWAAVGDALSYYQSWLLLEQPDGSTRAVFQEAARGSSALLRAADRAELTREWVDALRPAP